MSAKVKANLKDSDPVKISYPFVRPQLQPRTHPRRALRETLQNGSRAAFPPCIPFLTRFSAALPIAALELSLIFHPASTRSGRDPLCLAPGKRDPSPAFPSHAAEQSRATAQRALPSRITSKSHPPPYAGPSPSPPVLAETLERPRTRTKTIPQILTLLS